MADTKAGTGAGAGAGAGGNVTAMVAAATDAKVEPVELNLKSLLDVSQERFAREGGRESVTRLLYVGVIPRNSSQKDVCLYHKNFLKEIDADVTGLMILHQECFLNLVEGGPDVVMALLRHVHKNMSSPNATISSVRVLASTEDCPSRAFVTWSFRSVKLLKSDSPPDMEADSPVNLAYNTYSKLVKLGKQLTDADLAHADISAALDLLQQRYSSFIPAADLVKAFCGFEKLPDLEEYMELFDSPMEVDLESDRTWPVPPPLIY